MSDDIIAPILKIYLNSCDLSVSLINATDTIIAEDTIESCEFLIIFPSIRCFAKRNFSKIVQRIARMSR